MDLGVGFLVIGSVLSDSAHTPISSSERKVGYKGYYQRHLGNSELGSMKLLYMLILLLTMDGVNVL